MSSQYEHDHLDGSKLRENNNNFVIYYILFIIIYLLLSNLFIFYRNKMGKQNK
jgi:hypothetical protein